MTLLTDTMKDEIKKLCGETLFDEPMSRYTTLRVGGAADALVYPRQVEELLKLLLWTKSRKIPHFVLGAGSNLLVRDKGIRGIVVSLSRGFSAIRKEDEKTVYVETGVGLPRLVDWTAQEGLSGIEALAGIPGNVGGALFMNAGTRKGEIGTVVQEVTFVEKDGKLVTWPKEKIRFEYRKSHFPQGAVLLSARLSLNRASPESIREKIQADREKRIETQPLNVPNIGSVFKNPSKGHAGFYIEESGLKNVRVGGARVSSKHANFIVNEGQASARDVLALVGLIRDKVKERHGVLLEPEIRIVGEE